MFGLKRPLLTVASISWFLLTFVAIAGAVTITYGDSNRPVKFEGVSYNGANYQVVVQWNTNYQTAYTLRTPLFWGDEAGATAARSILSQALIDDSYTQAATQSHLCIPYDFVDPNVQNLSISLHSGADVFSSVATPVTQFYAEVGFTLWDVTVPNESPSWSKIKALFQ